MYILLMAFGRFRCGFFVSAAAICKDLGPASFLEKHTYSNNLRPDICPGTDDETAPEPKEAAPRPRDA